MGRVRWETRRHAAWPAAVGQAAQSGELEKGLKCTRLENVEASMISEKIGAPSKGLCSLIDVCHVKEA